MFQYLYVILVSRGGFYDIVYKYINVHKIGNIAHFANHSCKPNCWIEPWVVNGYARLVLVVDRDISEGEELTFYYNGKPKFKDICYYSSAKC